MRNIPVQPLPVRPGVAPEPSVSESEPAETWRPGVIQVANDEIAIPPAIGDDSDGASTTSGPPDPPPDPDPDLK